MNKILPALAGIFLLLCAGVSVAQQVVPPVAFAPISGVRAVGEDRANLIDQTTAPAAPQIDVTLIADKKEIEPGKPFRIAADFKLTPGWHIYYKQPGDTGMPTNVDLKLPEGYKIVAVEWEKPTRFEDSGFTSYGYADKTVIAITVMPPADLKPGDSVTFNADISWLACKDTCIPGNTTGSITLPVAHVGTVVQPDNQDRFANVGFTGDVTQLGKPSGSVFDQNLKPANGEEGRGFWTYLLFAFLGGIILNAMPCVLPVISLKVMRFVQEAGESRSKIIRLGMAYAAGTVSTCMVLAVAVILAKLLGYTVGWGFQFQEPLFLVAMATLLTIMSLGLFGVFFLQANSGKGLDNLSRRGGMAGAFFTGVVATILSTPCTAPFLGSAIGFAFVQPWWVIVAIFFAMGAGLAFPYVLLTLNPAWMKLLPKPGEWMENFKQAMGFVLMGSVVWLLYVLGRQVGPDGVAATVAFLLAASFGTWLYNKLGGFDATRRKKLILLAVALLLAGGTMYQITWPAVKNSNWTNAASNQTGSITWEKFSREAVDRHLKDGKVVFIDFTASWCQTCKFNEATVLSSQEVADAIKQNGVVALKADWTSNDPEITQVLAKFGSAGVPLYVIMSPHRPAQPIVLPSLLTTQTVIDGIKDASRP